MTESTTGETVIPGNASVEVEAEHPMPSAPEADAGDDEVTAEIMPSDDDRSDLAAEDHTGFYYGPVGKRRSPMLVIALCVFTFGLYGLWWHNRNTHEMADFDPQMNVHAGRSTWAVAIPWVIGLLTTLAGAARLVLIDMNVALPFNPHITETMAAVMLAGILVVPYLTVVLPFSAVAVVMTAERIRIIEEASGVTSDRQIRPAAAPMLLLIPLVGAALLIAKEQGRINATWERISPTPGRRRH